ncbi:MAG: OmpA family protein [Desulfomonilaceae bacterium]
MRSMRRFLGRFILILTVIVSSTWLFNDGSFGDDCRKTPNILVLFDASGFMKEKDHYQTLLKQMDYFSKAIPLTADGFFNIGLRHYGLKVGMGCASTESILSIQPWDPERFINSFPKSVSYGTSSLAAGLRAAGDEIASANGKSIIVVVGGGIESCKADPIRIAEQICQNNPDVEIHTFQIGNAQDGAYFMKGIAQKGRGQYYKTDQFNSPAGWHAWMLKYWVKPCGTTGASPSSGAAPASFAPILFDFNNFSVASKDPGINAANRASLDSLALALRQNPNSRVTLKGYSDGRGKPEQNLAVSRKRAQAVSQFLSTVYGIPKSRMSVQGMGASVQGLGAPHQQDDRMGRRVEIELSR